MKTKITRVNYKDKKYVKVINSEKDKVFNKSLYEQIGEDYVEKFPNEFNPKDRKELMLNSNNESNLSFNETMHFINTISKYRTILKKEFEKSLTGNQELVLFDRYLDIDYAVILIKDNMPPFNIQLTRLIMDKGHLKSTTIIPQDMVIYFITLAIMKLNLSKYSNFINVAYNCVYGIRVEGKYIYITELILEDKKEEDKIMTQISCSFMVKIKMSNSNPEMFNCDMNKGLSEVEEKNLKTIVNELANQLNGELIENK